MTERGKLIVIEGLDGAGTTTQVRLLESWLTNEVGIDLHTTREPSHGPIGAMIRAILTKRLTADPLTIAGLYATDRNDHIFASNGINEQLDQGKWVLMDRYYLSSFAYQASSMDEKQLNWLRTIHKYCPSPDLTLFVDVPVDVCMDRIMKNRHAEFELFDEFEILRKTAKQYFKAMEYFTKQGESFICIDGTQPIDAVFSDLTSSINKKFTLV
jgi:dTMP kinase